jgi:hypothetical protein
MSGGLPSLSRLPRETKGPVTREAMADADATPGRSTPRSRPRAYRTNPRSSG